MTWKLGMPRYSCIADMPIEVGPVFEWLMLQEVEARTAEAEQAERDAEEAERKREIQQAARRWPFMD